MTSLFDQCGRCRRTPVWQPSATTVTIRAGLVSVACRRTLPRRPEDWSSSEDPHDWMRDVRDVTQTLKLQASLPA